MKPLRILTYTLFFCFGIFFSGINAQPNWQSIVIESVNWKYLAATSEPDPNWYKPEFNDVSWKVGPGGLGYGDGDDATIVPPCNSLYIRTKATVSDVSLIKELLLDIDYDDAFVLYINGVEFARSFNINGAFPPYNGPTTVDREAKMYRGGSPERYLLNPSSLVNGTNVFALQILNHRAHSSDMSARVFIHANVDSQSQLFHPTPAWFVPPKVISSNLPLILIDTKGANINQDVKIMANMKVINNPTGINNSNDTTYEYNNDVGIKIRGFTSAGFPKKSFTVETRNPDSTNLNVPLLGLPNENDWVFHGPYPDKSLMRNAVMYHLGNTTGKWNPRTKFFELILNGSYNGAYTLVEKIKIDKNRLRLANLLSADTIGDELTGGYVLKLDRPESTEIEGVDYWVSPYRANTRLQQRQFFIFQDPEGGNLHKKQFNYIKQYITDFENALYSSDYRNPETGYYSYIDIQSFVDYYIMTELSRNLDGYRISTFLHKDKDSKGGKLTMGPLWDYDICLGNANFFSAGNIAGWVIDGMGDGDNYAMPFWWEKFRLDPYFNHLLKQRWNFMKDFSLNTIYINQFIDARAYELRDAQVRNFEKWDILNKWVWPNNAVPGSYEGEILYLKNWIRDRIKWMDTQIQAIPDYSDNKELQSEVISLRTSPNPFIDVVDFKYFLPKSGKVDIIIHNVLGQQMLHVSEMREPGVQNQPIRIQDSDSKMFTYQVLIDGKQAAAGKLVRK